MLDAMTGQIKPIKMDRVAISFTPRHVAHEAETNKVSGLRAELLCLVNNPLSIQATDGQQLLTRTLLNKAVRQA